MVLLLCNHQQIENEFKNLPLDLFQITGVALLLLVKIYFPSLCVLCCRDL